MTVCARSLRTNSRRPSGVAVNAPTGPDGPATGAGGTIVACPAGAADDVDATGCAIGGTDAAGDGGLGGAEDAAMPLGGDARAGAGRSTMADGAAIVDEGSAVEAAAGLLVGADVSETTDAGGALATPTSSVVSLVGALALTAGGDSAPLRLDRGLSANAAESMPRTAHAPAFCATNGEL